MAMRLTDKEQALVVKLLRLAVNAGAAQGEAENAMRKAIGIIRGASATVEDLGRILAPGSGPRWSPPPPPPPRPQRRHRMPFGKYKGDPITDIADDDPGYLEWVLDNCDLTDSLRQAIEEALA